MFALLNATLYPPLTGYPVALKSHQFVWNQKETKKGLDQRLQVLSPVKEPRTITDQESQEMKIQLCVRVCVFFFCAFLESKKYFYIYNLTTHLKLEVNHWF